MSTARFRPAELESKQIGSKFLGFCNVGIIDCGYRGHLMSYFANHNTGLAKVSNSLVNYNTEPYVVDPYSRLTQVCHCKLTPFYVSLHDNKDFFNETQRADGGFGSTGL